MSSSTPQDPTEYCCLCIPVRYALFMAAISSMLLSGVLGGLGIVALQRIGSQLTDFQLLTFLFHIIIHLLFAGSCLMGIYASMARSVTFTSIYTSLIVGQFLFSIASGTLCLYVLFNNAHAWDATRCLAIALDLFTENLCQRTPVFKSLATGFLGALWLIEIVGMVVGTSFLSQLREESIQLELLQPKYDRSNFYC